MAITDYASLKTAIAARADRVDTTTVIEEAVDAATMRLSRELRVVDQEGRLVATLTSEYSTLPADYNGVRSLRSNGKRLEYYVPEAFQTVVERNANPSKPIFTIEYQKLRVHPAPSAISPLDVELLYHARVTELVSPGDSNWVLADHPDLYLAASLVEVFMHLKDTEKADLWEGRTKSIMEQVIVSSRRRRYTSGQLVIRNV